MRRFLLPIVMFAVTAPAAALADDGACPPKVSADLLAALGEPSVTLSGQTIYQPSGVTMLGMPVSYVVVTKSGDTVQEIDYRFAGVTRKYGQRFPLNVLQAFDKAYSGTGCSNASVTSCGTSFESKTAGDLFAAEINEAYIDLPAKASGAGAAMVKADFSSQTTGPVFLVCQYNS